MAIQIKRLDGKRLLLLGVFSLIHQIVSDWVAINQRKFGLHPENSGLMLSILPGNSPGLHVANHCYAKS